MHRKLILSLIAVSALVLAGTWLVSSGRRSSTQSEAAATSSGESSAASSLNGNQNRALQSATAVVRAQPEESAPALDTAPVRLPGALIDPQPPEAAAAPGGKSLAWATVNGVETPPLKPNQNGEFPRVYTMPGEKVAVRIQMDAGAPGDPVAAAAEDGGRFDDGQPVRILKLDENRQAAFTFIPQGDEGSYRITVRHGSDRKVVRIWAATDPALALHR